MPLSAKREMPHSVPDPRIDACVDALPDWQQARRQRKTASTVFPYDGGLKAAG